jgi:hypothetical protein
MEELIRVLTEERNLLEVLVYRLETLRHFLTLDRPRSVEWASLEVDQASDLLRAAESRRNAAATRAGRDLGLVHPYPSLRELSSIDGPYRTTLEALRQEFLALTAQVEDLFDAVRRTVAIGFNHVNQAIGAMTGAPAGVGAGSGTLYGPDAHLQRSTASRFEGVL